MSDFPLSLLWAALAACGFALRYGLRSRDLVPTTGCAVAGWIVYSVASRASGPAQGYFAAALVIGILAEILAARQKKPATIYIVTAIFPLVPGSGMYYTMLHSVRGDLWAAILSGYDTLSSAGAIAAGLAVSSALSRLVSLRTIATRMVKTPGPGSVEAGPRSDALERSSFESGSGWHD